MQHLFHKCVKGNEIQPISTFQVKTTEDKILVNFLEKLVNYLEKLVNFLEKLVNFLEKLVNFWEKFGQLFISTSGQTILLYQLKLSRDLNCWKWTQTIDPF